MNNIVPEATANGQHDSFATIQVAGLTVAPSIHVNETNVALDFIGDGPGELLSFTPAEACAVAAALQAVAVHLMEQRQSEVAA